MKDIVQEKSVNMMKYMEKVPEVNMGKDMAQEKEVNMMKDMEKVPDVYMM